MYVYEGNVLEFLQYDSVANIHNGKKTENNPYFRYSQKNLLSRRNYSSLYYSCGQMKNTPK
jgi:flagellar biosynthesis/type III secretory pathway chaperone